MTLFGTVVVWYNNSIEECTEAPPEVFGRCFLYPGKERDPDAIQTAYPVPPPWLSGADPGGQQILRRSPATAQGNCAECGEQRLHQPVAADQQTVSAAASPVCPVRQTGTGGRPHRPAQRQRAAVLGREQLAGIVQGLPRQENRRGGQPTDLRVLGGGGIKISPRQAMKRPAPNSV